MNNAKYSIWLIDTIINDLCNFSTIYIMYLNNDKYSKKSVFLVFFFCFFYKKTKRKQDITFCDIKSICKVNLDNKDWLLIFFVYIDGWWSEHEI